MSSNEHDRLDRLLRRDARVPLPDAGFTPRVMNALPPRPAPRREWLAAALMLGSTALGSALAWIFAPSGVNVAQGFVDLAYRSLTPAALAALALSGALLACAVILAADTE